MVIGTQDPWAERGLIHHGAKHVITVEYMKIGALLVQHSLIVFCVLFLY